MADEAYLYPHSYSEAVRRNELELWQQSLDANISCRKAIEAAIQQGHAGSGLPSGCAAGIIGEYGYKRVQFVLANTMRYRGRAEDVSSEHASWARGIYVPEDSMAALSAANPLPALEAFVTQYRNAYQLLSLFDHTHCEADTSELDFTGKVLVLSTKILKETCWRQEDQLWYAHDGFGCRPHTRGRFIRSECLGDGEMARWNRHDFVGVLKDEHLPEWARERLEQIIAPAQKQAPELGGMDMT